MFYAYCRKQVFQLKIILLCISFPCVAKNKRDMVLMANSSSKHLFIKIFYNTFVASHVVIKGNCPLRAHQHI